MKKEELKISTGFRNHYDAIQQLAHCANSIVTLIEIPVAEGENNIAGMHDALSQIRQNLNGIVEIAWDWDWSNHKAKEVANE